MSKDKLFDLTGQVAFVTGAGQGVGRGIAETLAAYGAAVAVNDYFLDRAETVAQAIIDAGGKAAAIAADVSDLAVVRDAFARTEAALGPVSILVNNAGNGGPAGWTSRLPLFWETEPEDWDVFFKVNLYGVMNCCRAATPNMVKAGYGRIITIVSDAGRVGEIRMSDYAAAKAGAAGFTRALSKDLGRYGVTANNIAISTIDPNMPPERKEQFLASEQSRRQLEKYTIRRYGQPSDIAAMALFLASGASEWITGQTYPVNGGYSVSM